LTFSALGAARGGVLLPRTRAAPRPHPRARARAATLHPPPPPPRRYLTHTYLPQKLKAGDWI